MRAIIPLAAGLVIGLLAVYYVTEYVRTQRAPDSAASTVQVVRAGADIGPAVAITEGMVKVIKVPKALAPKNGFSTLDEVLGRVTCLMVPEGTPIVQRCLAPPGTPPGLPVRIRDGYRAVAVKVDESVGVAGWVMPDSRVDVIILLDLKDSGGKRGDTTYSRTLLQDVRVLAVGQDLGAEGESGAKLSRSVTLEVTPKQAQLLHMSASKGRLRLAMRNAQDAGHERLAANTADDLLHDESAAVPLREGVMRQVARLFRPPVATQPAVEDVASPPPPVVQPPDPAHGRDVEQADSQTEQWLVEVLAGGDAPAVMHFEREHAQAPWRQIGARPPSSRRRAAPAVAQAQPARVSATAAGATPTDSSGTEEDEEDTEQGRPLGAG